MGKECMVFVLVTYLLTFLLVHVVPNTPFLAPFVPGVIAILLTIYNGKKISSLFKKDSVKNLLCGLMIPLVTFPSLFGLGLLFSLIKYEPKLEPVGVVYSLIPTAFIGSFVGSAISNISVMIGWQGYFLKNIRAQISNFYTRGLLISLLYGIFFTIIVAGHTEHMSLPVICISFAQLLLTSIIYTWLFEKNGSIWSVVIANSLFYAFPVSLTPIFGVTFLQSVSFSLLLAVFYFLAVLGIVLFGNPNREGTFLKNCS